MKSITILRVAVAAALFLILAPGAHAKTIFVTNNGVDSSTCGPTGAVPCRSITRGIHHAVKGDLIVVGPGKYGDLNGNGVLGEPGEEAPPANCFCMLAVFKPVTIVSSDGAASTVIDARSVDVFNNVEITANGVTFGMSGLGFTVTETKAATTNCFGIDLGTATGANVQGNLVVASHLCTGGGISASGNNAGGGVIHDNQVMGWEVGINVGPNIVKRNAVQLNGVGINGFSAAVTGNVVSGNSTGIELNNAGASASGNAVVGNGTGILVDSFDGTIPSVKSNNVFGNSVCGVLFDVDNVVATNDYWGSAAGPAPPVDICGSTSTAVVTPFATKPFTITAPVNP